MKTYLQKHFSRLLVLILILSAAVRLLPLYGNNFYFTMDQGNDAVHVRKLNYQHRLLLRGTETGGIPGLYTGPGWYWLISTGFLISNNHPVGPVIFLIAVNLVTTFFLIKYLKEKTNTSVALLIGTGHQFFWPYYDITRYAFNPFLLVPLSYLLILLLVKALGGHKKSLILAAIPVGAAFHFEIAAFVAWLIFYFLIIAHLFLKKTIKPKTIFLCILTLSLFFLPTLIYETKYDFRQTNAVIHHFKSNDSVVSATQFKKIAVIFVDLLNQGIFPSRALISIILVITTIYFAKKPKPISKSASHFAFTFFFLTLTLLTISYLWFGSSIGWQTWHTVYLPPLIFISLLLINLAHPSKIGLTIVGLIILSQSLIFVKNYRYFGRPNDDPSLLVNELKAIDWAYNQTENRDLSIYTSIPSVEDYNYQYLIWWWGLKKYGYLPCEYNTYPNAPKTYLPKGYQIFEKPKGNCPSKIRILIMEPDRNNAIDSEWYHGVTKDTDLLATMKVGKIKLEKRLVK